MSDKAKHIQAPMDVPRPPARTGLCGPIAYMLVCAVPAILLLVSGMGCVSSGSSMASPVGADPNPSHKHLDAAKGEKELAIVRRMLRAGDYSHVIPRLTSIITTCPGTSADEEARYFLGLAFYKLEGYDNAAKYFRQYIERAPEGKYSQVTREYLASLGDESALRDRAIEKLKARIAAYDQSKAMSAEELASQLKLADLYWGDSRYDDAGVIYLRLLAQWPELETDATIRTRVERSPDGSHVLLTPNEVQRRYAHSDPLSIYNVQTYRSGLSGGWNRFSTKDRFFHVSGEVTNRGQETLHQVHVIVTIYGSGSLVYDTKSVPVGSLPPGEIRAFSTRFGNFDNIENVRRYECVGTYAG